MKHKVFSNRGFTSTINLGLERGSRRGGVGEDCEEAVEKMRDQRLLLYPLTQRRSGLQNGERGGERGGGGSQELGATTEGLGARVVFHSGSKSLL